MRIKDLLQNNKIILTDGAMGTYFTQKSGQNAALCEAFCLSHPELILEIHREYIASGAQILRTNSFAANSQASGPSFEEVAEICRRSYALAKEAAGENAAVFADIGPINSDNALEEYLAIADVFLSCGARDILFETFHDTECIIKAAKYIKSKEPRAFVAASFTFSPDKRTRTGHSVESIMECVARLPEIDLLGFNCGCGPTHMLKVIEAALPLSKPFMALPNAGYPSRDEGQAVYSPDIDFFAETTAQLAGLGAAVIGGCCGTTPTHIAALREHLAANSNKDFTVKAAEAAVKSGKKAPKPFAQKVLSSEFILAVELDPPHSSDLTKVISCAKELKKAGADIITISDSPMSRPKLDSVICSARIKREADIEVLPHICCRDKNLNALRSSALGAHSEGIRSILAVTGDLVSEIDRGTVKPVFNVSSLGLLELLSTMNRSDFKEEPFVMGAALNPFVTNPSAELERAKRKIENGASFFLTQPVFNTDCVEFIKSVRGLGVKVLVGIMPLVSRKNARYMSSEVPGIRIPSSIIEQFREDMSREEAEAAGVRIAIDIARSVRPFADGLYLITPFNRTGIICSIINSI
ncbi:MAG: bifunctional homocysteine S-methyltransferase/methylenetetrahydrofolate reductase [Oscillospiraceae bacterium]|jgi:homocysteine S-methyltransferase|nr:bifunctional homocysteine S-methyltransferase/methylenetetrahydrofolate reductase [Oscillospiraceae bacterium]